MHTLNVGKVSAQAVLDIFSKTGKILGIIDQYASAQGSATIRHI